MIRTREGVRYDYEPPEDLCDVCAICDGSIG